MSLLLLSLLACGVGSVDLGDDSGASADGGSADGGADGGGADGGGADAGDGGADGGDGGGDGGDGGDDGGSEPVLAPDYRAPGTRSVRTTTGSTSIAGCAMDWTRFEPADGGDGVVLLAHGFVRSQDQHAELAEHMASWGLTVLTLNLCHSLILDTDHEQNGLDMVALGAALGLSAPVYVGHSAGGLAAVVAGAADPAGAGVLGLDPVDSSDIGVDVAGGIALPVAALMGEPSACNASSNGLSMISAAPEGQALVVTDADHCDFEGPTDWVCTLVCTGGNDSFTDEEIVATMRGFATAAALSMTGAAAEAAQWWTPGEDWYEDQLALGAVRAP